MNGKRAKCGVESGEVGGQKTEVDSYFGPGLLTSDFQPFRLAYFSLSLQPLK